MKTPTPLIGAMQLARRSCTPGCIPSDVSSQYDAQFYNFIYKPYLQFDQQIGIGKSMKIKY